MLLSKELAIGEVKPLRYFGQELAIWRGEDGKVRMLGAICKHLGAHMGHGGKVHGNLLECPFHAWRYDGEAGLVKEIPYSPSPECSDPNWTEYQETSWNIWGSLQNIGENGVDFAHFQFIHGTADLPEAELSWGEWDRNAIVRAKMGTPRGIVNGVITSKSIGPGQSWVRFEGICETLLIACLTPVDEDHVHVRYFFSQPKDSKTGRVAQAIIADVVKQMDQDKVIWDRQYYAYKPIICEGDGPIAKFRMFYSKYYAGNDGKPRHVLAAKEKAKA